MHGPIDRVAQTTAFVTPVVEHWLGPSETHCCLFVVVVFFCFFFGLLFL